MLLTIVDNLMNLVALTTKCQPVGDPYNVCNSPLFCFIGVYILHIVSRKQNLKEERFIVERINHYSVDLFFFPFL